jgi:hypothetical protein
MKTLFTILLAMLFISCTETEYTYIGQEIIDGKVSATREGYHGRFPKYPKIWIQTPTTTRVVEIPYSYEGKWKVGDSCLLIIEKYKENEP